MKNKIIASFVSFCVLSLIAVTVVHAQVVNNPPTTTTNCDGSECTHVALTNPFSLVGDGGLLGLIQAIIDKIILPIGGVLAVLSFIYTGFMFVKARGNPGEIKTAKDALLYTVIGTALLLGAEAVSKVICGTISQLGPKAC